MSDSKQDFEGPSLLQMTYAEIMMIRKMIHAYIVTTLSEEDFKKFMDSFNTSKTTYDGES